MELYHHKLNNLQAGRFRTFMEKMTRVDGKAMTNDEFIWYMINKGYNELDIHHSETSTGKPKKEYYIRKVDEDGRKTGYTITKTEYDFLAFLLEKGYTEEEYRKAVQEEQDEINRVEEEKRQAELEERKKRAEESKIKSEQRREEYKKLMQRYIENGKKMWNIRYDITFTLALQQEEEDINEKVRNLTNFRGVTEDEAYRTAVSFYREEILKNIGAEEKAVLRIRSMMENADPLIRTFFKILVGYTEGEPHQTTDAKIRAILQGRTYTAPVEPEKHKFRVLSAVRNKGAEVLVYEGERVEVEGFTFHVYKHEKKKDYYSVEEMTGLSIMTKETAAAAKKGTREIFKDPKVDIKSVIERSIARGYCLPLEQPVKETDIAFQREVYGTVMTDYGTPRETDGKKEMLVTLKHGTMVCFEHNGVYLTNSFEWN